MRSQPHVPDLRVPRSDKPFVGGTVTSVVLHGLILVGLVWGGSRTPDVFFRAGGGLGPAGGGGGGGGSRVTYVELPPFVTAAPPARLAETEPAAELPLPTPELRVIDTQTPVVKLVEPTGPVVAALAVGRGAGSGGDAGSGAGTGGGVGTGEGAGVGSGAGPGAGGESGDGFGPRSKQMLLPPDAPETIKGQEFLVRFWINEQGKVIRVEVEPRIDDRRYRRKFLEKMRQFTFYPARSSDGTPVPSQYEVFITP